MGAYSITHHYSVKYLVLVSASIIRFPYENLRRLGQFIWQERGERTFHEKSPKQPSWSRQLL